MAKKKRGRPRKEGARYPSGDLKPQGITPTQWHRIRTDAVRLTNDPRLGDAIGSLSFHGLLTDSQAAAAHRIGEIYGRYEAVNGLVRSSRSPSYEIGMRGAVSVTDADTEIAARFYRLQDAIPASERAILEELCAENRAINSAHLPKIRERLDILAVEHFKFAGQHRRNGRVPPRPLRDPHTQALADRAHYRSEPSVRGSERRNIA